MKNLGKYFNFIFLTMMLSYALSSWISPGIIKLLFTPPVSFGTNCEPAASWAMSKLIVMQVVSLLIGLILGIFAGKYFLHKKSASESTTTQVKN